MENFVQTAVGSVTTNAILPTSTQAQIVDSGMTMATVAVWSVLVLQTSPWYAAQNIPTTAVMLVPTSIFTGGTGLPTVSITSTATRPDAINYGTDSREDHDQGLSGGAIAGAVVESLVGAVIIMGILLFFVLKRKRWQTAKQPLHVGDDFHAKTCVHTVTHKLADMPPAYKEQAKE